MDIDLELFYHFRSAPLWSAFMVWLVVGFIWILLPGII